MKKVIMILLGLVLVISITACGGKTESTPQEESEPMVGGWEVNTDDTAATLPDDAQKAFSGAMEAFTGGKLIPVAYLGRQIVAGTNYQILCKSTTVTAEPITLLQVVTVYEDLDGTAEITNITDFNIADYTLTEEEEQEESEPIDGGWEVPEETSYAPIPDDVKTAYSKAVKDSGDSKLEPMAYLGRQIVSGNNYAVLCYNSKGKNSIQVVIIYQDLDGNAMINNIKTVDPADYS